MEHITELERRPSPVPRPQSIAFDGTSLWMGSRATRRVYAIDPGAWSAHEVAEAPEGVPWGITAAGDDLMVIHGLDDGDRWVRRLDPAHGFARDAFMAPDGTGSQLGWDGATLSISQWYNQRLVHVDRGGRVLRTIDVPHGICGQVVVDGVYYLVTTDDEDGGVYWLTRVDARSDRVNSEDLAIVPFAARGLAFDGERFWTNHREADEIVAFARPD